LRDADSYKGSTFRSAFKEDLSAEQRSAFFHPEPKPSDPESLSPLVMPRAIVLSHLGLPTVLHPQRGFNFRP